MRTIGELGQKLADSNGFKRDGDSDRLVEILPAEIAAGITSRRTDMKKAISALTRISIEQENALARMFGWPENWKANVCRWKRMAGIVNGKIEPPRLISGADESYLSSKLTEASFVLKLIFRCKDLLPDAI